MFLKKRKQMIAIGVLVLFLFTGCTATSREKIAERNKIREEVKEKATEQAIQWCYTKYGKKVMVKSVSVKNNNFFDGFFLAINPDYGPSDVAEVKVNDGVKEFSILCDTKTGINIDDAQKKEIHQGIQDYIQNTLQIQNSMNVKIDYGSYGRVAELYKEGELDAFLEKSPLKSIRIECVEQSLQFVEQKQLENLGKVYILNFLSEKYWQQYRTEFELESASNTAQYVFILTDAITQSYGDTNNPDTFKYYKYELQPLDENGIQYCWLSESGNVETPLLWEKEPPNPDNWKTGYHALTDTYWYDFGNKFSYGSLWIYIPEELIDLPEEGSVTKFNVYQDNKDEIQVSYFDEEVSSILHREGYYIFKLSSPYKKIGFTLLEKENP